MIIKRGTSKDAREIAAVYKGAFPASVKRFFPNKNETRLLDLLEHSFHLVFLWGGQAVVAIDKQDKICGYCLWRLSESKPLPNFGKQSLQIGFKLLSKLNLKEALHLSGNKLVMLVTTRKDKALKGEGEIISLAVHPTYQGQGLGTKLLNEALKQLGQKTIALNVLATNEAGKKLYQQAGFQVVGRTKDFSGKWLMLVRRGAVQKD